MTLLEFQQIIDRACRATCSFINRSTTNIGSEPGEESITDYFLLEIATNSHGIIHTKKFTHQQEAKISGADWEWWVFLPTGYCCFHVQAKRLSSLGISLDLGYRNKSNVQIEQLMKYAAECKAAPVYVFYAPKYTGRQLRCGKFLMNGVGFIEAYRLHDRYKAGQHTINHNDVISESWPMPCLMCSFSSSCYNSTTGLAQQLQFINDNNSIPPYVYILAEDGDFNMNSLSQDQRLHLAHFDRVIVSDMRSIDR